eukprot:6164211-Ditylum_brightwellii.AAC.1
MCVQFFTQGATNQTPIAGIGNKVKHLLLKLQEANGTNKFTMYNEEEKKLNVEISPKKAPDIKVLLNYEVKESTFEIIVM